MNRLAMITCWLAVSTLAGCEHKELKPKREVKASFLVTSPLRKDTVLTKNYVAQIRAIQHVELRALERGYLEGVFVDEGEFVKTGQRMFQIMPLLYQAELKKAEAEVHFAELKYANTKHRAHTNVVAPNEVALAAARVNKAKAAVALAKAHRSLTEIKAPFDGIVGRFKARLGSLLNAGDLLTTLSDNSTMWVYFNVPEAEYLTYKSSSQPAEQMPVQLVMANGAPFDQPGKIETIASDFNSETGNITFRAAFPNPEGLLRHAETGNILVNVPLHDALLIPQKATFETLDTKYVFVVGDNNIVRAHSISIAAELPQLYAVRSGLSEHDKILLEGLRKVRDGSQIALGYVAPGEVIAHLDLPVE